VALLKAKESLLAKTIANEKIKRKTVLVERKNWRKDLCILINLNRMSTIFDILASVFLMSIFNKGLI